MRRMELQGASSAEATRPVDDAPSTAKRKRAEAALAAQVDLSSDGEAQGGGEDDADEPQGGGEDGADEPQGFDRPMACETLMDGLREANDPTTHRGGINDSAMIAAVQRATNGGPERRAGLRPNAVSAQEAWVRDWRRTKSQTPGMGRGDIPWP